MHGILHLLGYDHAEPEEKAEMFGLQDRLLASWRAGRAARTTGPASAAAAGEALRVMSDQGWLIAAAIVLVLMAGWWASAEATLARLSAVGAEQLAGSAARPPSGSARSSPTCPAI